MSDERIATLEAENAKLSVKLTEVSNAIGWAVEWLQPSIPDLQSAMNSAIVRQDFEEAARMRDELRVKQAAWDRVYAGTTKESVVARLRAARTEADALVAGGHA